MRDATSVSFRQPFQLAREWGLGLCDNRESCFCGTIAIYRTARNFGGQNFGGFGGLLSKRQNFNRQNVMITWACIIRLGNNPPKY